MNRDTAQQVMLEALTLAETAGAQGEVPVAAIITDITGKMIAAADNAMKRDNNPLAHAEMRVIGKAQKLTNADYFSDYCLFVTLEPCAMCAQAIAYARFAALYFAAYDVKAGAVDHGARIFAQPGCNHVPEIIGGLCESQAQNLLQKFFKARR